MFVMLAVAAAVLLDAVVVLRLALTRLSARLGRLELALAVAAILVVTVNPNPGDNRVGLLPWTKVSGTNAAGNVFLFAPLGAVLLTRAVSLRATVLAGFALSLAVELAQLGVPGRTTSTADILCNTLGAAAGWALAAQLRRRVEDGRLGSCRRGP